MKVVINLVLLSQRGLSTETLTNDLIYCDLFPTIHTESTTVNINLCLLFFWVFSVRYFHLGIYECLPTYIFQRPLCPPDC